MAEKRMLEVTALNIKHLPNCILSEFESNSGFGRKPDKEG
jgi:hypothetical protein